jgi:hypothetical protein
MKRSLRLLSASAGAALVLGCLAAPAFAEGSRSGSFWNARDGFTSKRWIDNQQDSKNTVITWSGCKLSNGDKLKSVQFGLWDDWGVLPDALVGSYRTLKTCKKSASATWYRKSSAYTLRDGTFYWRLGLINGDYRGYLSGKYKASF